MKDVNLQYFQGGKNSKYLFTSAKAENQNEHDFYAVKFLSLILFNSIQTALNVRC